MKHNEYMEIGHAMLDYSRRFKAFMKSELAAAGINFVEGMTVLYLYGADGRTADSLTEAVSCDKSVMTRALQHLEKEGLVLRKQNPDDGRSWIFCATEDGKERAEAVIDVIKRWSKISFADFTEKETKTLLELLLKL